MPCFRFTLPCWTASNLVLPTGATISVKSSGSTLPSPIVSQRNQQLRPLSTSLASGTTVFLGPVIIAVSGIAPGPAAILPINKVWSTSARIVSRPITSLVHAQLAHRLLPPADYPTQILHPFPRPANFRLPFRRLPPFHQPLFPFLRSLQWSPLPQRRYLVNFHSLATTHTLLLFVTFFARNLRSRTPLVPEFPSRRS